MSVRAAACAAGPLVLSAAQAGRRHGRRRFAAAVAVVTVVALGLGKVAAHQQGVSYSDISVEEGRLRYDLTLSNHDLTDVDADGDGAITSDEVLARYPALRRRFEQGLSVTAGGARCPLVLQDFFLDPTGAVLFRLRGSCPDAAPLRITFGLFAQSLSAGSNFAKIRYRGALTEHVFTRDGSELEVAAAASVRAVLRRFFILGIEHIATGYDHVLFLLALLLVGGGMRSLIGIVTAFTVAHSITLALATLDVVTLPSRLVESAIALSIAWVALENIVLDRVRGRWRITFAFGLVHGFGFATILRAMHLPLEGLVASLVAFNLGVETGQVVVVLLAYPLVAAIQRTPRRRVIVGVTSGLILTLASYWFVTRAFE